MTATIQTLLLLLAVLVVVAIIGRRFNTAPSILLVIAGIVLALTPGLPRIELAPELVLFGILPPLIYSAGVAMSWREFRFNLRPIALLAFGYVLFTTCAVAAMAHWLLGMPLAVAFVLGAIVAPTDAVAPLSILRQLGVPRRLIVILEGEGLANDATALILYRFAIAAAGTGVFSLWQATGTFALIVVGEITFGIGIGWLSLRLRRWTRDPRVEITLSLLTPYAAFLVPAHFGGSGVLATMTAGLFASWNGPLLIPAATRLQGIFFWDPVVYLLEGMVFLVTGLQMRTLLDRTGTVLLHDSILAVLLTVVVVIAARFMWIYPAAYIPRWLSPSLARRDPLPPWQWLFSLAFVGVRGVVSLAAALERIPVWSNRRGCERFSPQHSDSLGEIRCRGHIRMICGNARSKRLDRALRAVRLRSTLMSARVRSSIGCGAGAILEARRRNQAAAAYRGWKNMRNGF
jgi:monovalent cation/hydrogen antiporter